MDKMKLIARRFRKNMTIEENKLWFVLKNKQFYNFKFLRQYVIGEYIVDFVCREKKIIIEIDGGQHNFNANIKHDKKRTEFLESLGYKVIRFWNNDINDNMEGVYLKLQEIFEIEKLAPTLPLPRKGGKYLVNLQDKNLYYVGGVVRDELLGKESYDVDLVYVGDAIEYARNLADAKILRVNESFGTVRVSFGGHEVDIASTRNERYPQKGHLPEVFDVGCGLKEDVLRRDFTINAMAKSTIDGEIVDYTGGMSDLKAKKLRVLHDESFIDDPTRIVRALKFSVRFGFELEENTQKLQEKYLNNINYDMSYKRLKKELEETFNLNSQIAFEKFVKQGIYKLVAPNKFVLPQVNFQALINDFKPKCVWIIYIGLLPDISNLPLTKVELKIVEDYRALLNKSFKSDFEIYKNFEGLNIESIIMFAAHNEKAVRKYFTELKDIKISLNGDDLQKLGIKPSEKYQQCFDYVLSQKLKNPKMKPLEELDLARNFFNITQ